jgi:hypothetical protein
VPRPISDGEFSIFLGSQTARAFSLLVEAASSAVDREKNVFEINNTEQPY